MTGTRAEDPLVTALRAAGRDLTGRRTIRDLDRTLDEIVLAAVATVPRADAGGVSVTENGAIAARSPSDPSVRELDRLQAELREGPCITAIDDPPGDGIVVAHDLAGADATRWPRFAPRAVAAGYRSILSSELTTDGGMRAALNLYATEPDAFDTGARRIAGLFAVQAATLLHGTEQVAHLQHAIGSRDVIGRAKGILAERFTLDDDEAFGMLVRSSQDTNIKLVDVARWLCDDTDRRRTGSTPPLAG